MANVGSVIAHIGADISGYQSAMRTISSSSKSAMSGVSNQTVGATGKLSKMTSSAMSIAKGVGAVALVSKGIGILRESVGSAVARFDTLNAYPKVMKQMGYSTQDTNKSVGILKKGVDGLPTSLQDLTKSAQSFAILEKNASKGAKTATALNDAFLASGASAGDASRGVQQYSQMLATGKVDMQSWRTLQETMPYALTKVAKSFGLTGKSAERDLYAKLQSGEITMDELNDRFVKLDGGARGFAKTARSATGGIGTSFTNMRNAVTNGMADMLTSVDNGLKKAGTGGIAKIFDQAKVGIKSAFKSINTVVQASMPVVVGVFKALYPVVKNLAPLIAGLGGGFITASVGATAISKAVNGVASAFGAVARHPILSMILLLATAFYEAYTNIKPFHDFVNKLAGKIGELAGKIPQSTSAMNGLKTALGVLGGGAGLGIVIAGFAKFKKGLDIAKKATDSVKSPLSTAKEGVSGLGTSAKSASPKMMGIATAILEIGVGVGAATAGIGLMALGFTKLASTGNAGLVVIVAMVGAVIAVAGAFALLGPTLTASAVGIGVFGASILAIGAGVLAFGAGINLAAQAILLLSNNMSAIIPVMTAMGVGFAAMITGFITQVLVTVPQITQAFFSMLTQIMTQAVTYVPQIAAAFANLLISIINAIAAYAPAIAISVTNLMVSVLGAVGNNAPRVVAAFAAMLGQLGEAVIQTMPYVSQLIGAMMAALATIVMDYSSTFRQLGGVLIKSLGAGITGRKYDASKAAADVMKGAGQQASTDGMKAFDQAGGNSAIKGLQSISKKNGDAKKAGSDLSKSGADGVSSKSGDFNKAGSKLGKNANDGIRSKKDGAHSAGSSVGSSGANGARGQQGAFQSAGSFIGQGLVSGIRSMQGSAMSTAASIAAAAAGAIRRALKIHSPSRVTYALGEFVGAGLINGIKSQEKAVGTAASLYANAIQDQKYEANARLTASSSAVAGKINGGLETLDDDVKEQAAQSPIFEVYNEIVGDKITTTVNSKNARRQSMTQFMNGGM